MNGLQESSASIFTVENGFNLCRIVRSGSFSTVTHRIGISADRKDLGGDIDCPDSVFCTSPKSSLEFGGNIFNKEWCLLGCYAVWLL
jgi:hypothetical protein